MKVIEFKVRENGNLEKWEDMPVTNTLTCNGASGKEEKMGISTMVGQFHRRFDVKEIRWNYQGSLQGHYVS